LSDGHRAERLWCDSPWLILLSLLGLILRVGYVVVADRIDPFLVADPLHGDAASYDRIACNLLTTGEYGELAGRPAAFWPPLYPLFLAAVYSIFGYHLLVARLVQALLGAGAVVAVYAAARTVLGRPIARLAGLGGALYPYLVYFGNWLISEALYLLLLALALWVMARQQRRSSQRGLAGLGVLFGLAILAKPAAIFMLPLVVCWALVAPPDAPLPARLGRASLVLLVTALVVSPWTVRNYRAFDAFIPVSTNGGYTFYGANNAQAFGGHREGFPPPLPGLSDPEAQDEYYRRGLEWIAEHPADFARLALSKLARLFSPLSVASWETDYPLPTALDCLVRGLYGAFLITAFGGALLGLRRWRALFPFYIPILSVLASAVVFYGDTRYTLPMVPSLLIFAALAVSSASERLRLPEVGNALAAGGGDT
jgi:4-amino-4-deoxy-L-arabinose transferase-like glycosyltransferase